MAITWGQTVTKSGGVMAWKLGHETTQSPTAVAAATGSVTVTTKLYIWVRYAVSDNTSTLSWSGSYGSGSKTVSVSTTDTSGTGWSTSNILLLHTLTRSFAPSYAGTTTTSFSASLSGIDYIPGTGTTSGSWTTGARPYAAPAAPSGLTVTRSSDTQHGLNWARNSPGSASAPYETQELQRWDNVSNAYSSVATVGNVASFTDTGTRAARRYRWRIRARNSGGVSAWAYSPYVYTTPTPPSNVVATKSGADIVVTWDPSPSPLTNYRLAYEDGGAGTTWAGITTTGTSYTAPSPDPTLTHRYLVAAQAGDAPLLLSEYVSSNTVQLQAPPKAPTGLGPSVIDNAVATSIYWKHQPVDTTAQTAREYQWRLKGSTSWTSSGKVASSSEKATVAAGAWPIGTIEWQVRTWGAHANPSPWSATYLTTVASRPTVDLTAPAPGTFQSSRLTATWAFSTPGGGAQLAYWVRLYAEDGTTVLESREATSTASSYTFGRTVADRTSYVVGVKVKNAEGLWSTEDRVAISVVYASPPTASLELSWNSDRGAVVATITHPDPVGGQVAAVSAELWRAIGDGAWELVAAGLDPASVVLDPIPAVGAPAVYKVVTVSSLPSTAETAPVPFVSPNEGWLYLNSGPGWSRCVRVRGGVKLGRHFAVETELIQFAGDGPPVEVRGEGTARSLDVSVRLAPAVEAGASAEELEAFIAASPAPVAVRAPDGTRFYGSFPAISSEAYWTLRTGKFTLTEVSRRG